VREGALASLARRRLCRSLQFGSKSQETVTVTSIPVENVILEETHGSLDGGPLTQLIELEAEACHRWHAYLNIGLRHDQYITQFVVPASNYANTQVIQRTAPEGAVYVYKAMIRLLCIPSTYS